MKPHIGRSPGGNIGLEIDMRDITTWKPTVAQVRETILDHLITGMNQIAAPISDVGRAFLPTEKEVVAINESAWRAVTAGRMIDFGNIPNEVIMHGGNRGGPLYYEGALGHPFIDPWLFMHSWESGVSIYLVQLIERDKPVGGVFEAVELQPVDVHNIKCLMIADRVILLENDAPPESREALKYCASTAPSPWRFLPDLEDVANMDGKGRVSSPQESAAGNVLDPVMTVLLMLNTKSVERETVDPPLKVNRNRAKHGKRLIPPYQVVHSAPYVTAVQYRIHRRRGEPQGGTHASPVAHLRWGHWRNYQSGAKTFIQDTLVNATAEARESFKAQRSHYSAGAAR